MMSGRSSTDAAQIVNHQRNNEELNKTSKVFNLPSYTKGSKPAKLEIPPEDYDDEEIDDTKTPIHVNVQKADRFFSDPR